MEFMDLINGRYSVRRYESKPVEGEKLEKILEAVRVAPTAANKQPFKFIVVNTEGREEELKTIYGAEWFTQAPIVICGCAVPGEGWVRRDGKNYSEVDVTIAMDHLILEATNSPFSTEKFTPSSARTSLSPFPYTLLKSLVSKIIISQILPSPKKGSDPFALHFLNCLNN